MSNFFQASTRLGNTSRRLLIMEKEAWEEARKNWFAPHTRKAIMMYSASLPFWWLAGATPDQEYDPLWEDPDHIATDPVLLLQSGRWKGVDATGKEFFISNDPEMGLMRHKINDEEVRHS